MPLVARKNSVDLIASPDGAQGDPCAFNKGTPIKWHWNTDTIQYTLAGSSNVFVHSVGVVRAGDVMTTHPDENPCTSSPIDHTPTLSTYSPNVYANFLNIGRLGDVYKVGGAGPDSPGLSEDPSHPISVVAQGDVFANS
jgi:hypothetical protein